MDDVVDVIDTTGNTLFDNILTACLYLGAAFQLICIFSVIILPEREDQTADDAVGCEVTVPLFNETDRNHRNQAKPSKKLPKPNDYTYSACTRCCPPTRVRVVAHQRD